MTDLAASPNRCDPARPGTNPRPDAEPIIEELRLRGGIVVEGVRATRKATGSTDPDQLWIPPNVRALSCDARRLQ